MDKLEIQNVDLVIVSTPMGIIVGEVEQNCLDKLFLKNPLGLIIQKTHSNQLGMSLQPLFIPSTCLEVSGAALIWHAPDMEPAFRQRISEEYTALIVQKRSGIVLTKG